MVIGHSAGFDFLKKKFEIFFRVRVRARYESSLVFGLSLVLSMVKFKFSAGIQFFGPKTTSHGKSDLKNELFGQVYHVKWFSAQKFECLLRT